MVWMAKGFSYIGFLIYDQNLKYHNLGLFFCLKLGDKSTNVWKDLYCELVAISEELCGGMAKPNTRRSSSQNHGSSWQSSPLRQK